MRPSQRAAIGTQQLALAVYTPATLFADNMTSNEQRAALQRKIWDIANNVRGAVDGWDFKQYVLGTLFYRFISENFIDYITGGDASVNYAAMVDDDETIQAAKDDAIKTKGCPRRSKSEPCRSNIEPGLVADQRVVSCG